MQARRQLLMWTSVILALSLVLFGKLLENSSLVNRSVNDTRLAGFLSESDSSTFPQHEEANGVSRLETQRIEKKSNLFENNPASSHPRPNPPSVPMHVYYVQENDTLWRIAKKHHLDLYTLVSVNKLENPNLIRQGQVIRIPGQRGILRTVRRNETLEDIALQYDVTIQSIVDANRIADADVIQAGWELFIPRKAILYSTRD